MNTAIAKRFGLILLAIAPSTAVAQEFLLPPPGPPRASCNSIVNSGGDIGDTIPIDVSGTTGTIEFQYDTASQPDRMVVFIDRHLAYDSGFPRDAVELLSRLELRQPGELLLPPREPLQ